MAMGVPVRFWDTLHGPGGDLTRRPVVRGLCSDIAAGRVLAVMLAPPCGPWTTAADRVGAIRSASQPWGLPRHLLSEKQLARLASGNKTMRAALAIIRCCEKFKVPCILEHPVNSRVFFTREVRGVIDRGAVVRCLDQCQEGARWRKRTRFLCLNIDILDSSCLDRRCCQINGICSKSGRQHIVLEGNAPNGAKWTAIAAAYPPALNRKLAKVLLSEWRASLYNRPSPPPQ